MQLVSLGVCRSRFSAGTLFAGDGVFIQQPDTQPENFDSCTASLRYPRSSFGAGKLILCVCVCTAAKIGRCSPSDCISPLAVYGPGADPKVQGSLSSFNQMELTSH